MTPTTRKNRFTLRLSDNEKAELEQLSNQLNWAVPDLVE